MNIMTTIGNFLIYSARSPENNPNINININMNNVGQIFAYPLKRFSLLNYSAGWEMEPKASPTFMI